MRGVVVLVQAAAVIFSKEERVREQDRDRKREGVGSVRERRRTMIIEF